MKICSICNNAIWGFCLIQSSNELNILHFLFLRNESYFLFVQTKIFTFGNLERFAICRLPIEPYPTTKTFNEI